MAASAASTPPPRTRPGGRSARVVNDVLEATLEVLAERGYAGLSVEEVAVRASVNKSTVYRRWPTKPALVQSALSRMSESDPSPDSGSLRDDLFEFFRHRLARMATPRGRSVARVVLLERNDPELSSIIAALKHERPSVPSLIIDRAITRGELPATTDHALLTEALLALYSRSLWQGHAFADSMLRRLIDLMITGAQHGGARLVAPERPARTSRSSAVEPAAPGRSSRSSALAPREPAPARSPTRRRSRP